MRVAGLILISLAPLRVDAQSTDSLPFRAGQWGSEFSVSESFASAGLLRFGSNRRAWLVDVAGSFRSGTQSGNLFIEDRTDIQLRVGPRWYRPIGARLFQFATVGPNIGYLYAKSIDGSATQRTTLKQHSTALGVFGELGAGWLVRPQLALGAAWQARAGYVRVETDQAFFGTQQEGKASQTFADFGVVTLRAALHF